MAIKILFFIPELRSGGAERQLTELLGKLTLDKRFDIVLVTFGNNQHYINVNDMNIKFISINRSSKYDLGSIARFYRICREEKPDIIHSWNSLCTLYSFLPKVALKVKLINGSIRNCLTEINQVSMLAFKMKLGFSFSDVVVSNSEAGIKSYSSPSSKSVCIYNGFDFERIKYGLEPKVSSNFPEDLKDHLKLGMVASFYPNKDFTGFIEASVELIKEGNNIVVVLIGDGPDRTACENLIPHEFRKYFLFTGRVSDVESYLHEMDIGVLLSTPSHGEGIPNSIMEYMSFKLPVVASDSGGTSELVVDECNGYLIPQLDKEQLKRKLVFLINSPVLRVSLGEKGYDFLASSFNIDLMVERYKSLYLKQVE